LILKEKSVFFEKNSLVIQIKAFLTAFAGIFVIGLLSSFFASFLRPEIETIIKGKANVFLVFLLCLSTGYLEESFFRLYLVEKLKYLGVAFAVGISAVLFAFFHIWEGPFGVFNAALSAVFLSRIYLSNKSIHPIALAHSTYNFLIYMMSI
jgi:membrane protease YdiL (CAAX protease family)